MWKSEFEKSGDLHVNVCEAKFPNYRQLPVNVIVIVQPHSNGPFSLAARLALPAAEFKCYWDDIRSSFLVRELSLNTFS